jgi:hypothetical protein
MQRPVIGAVLDALGQRGALDGPQDRAAVAVDHRHDHLRGARNIEDDAVDLRATGRDLHEVPCVYRFHRPERTGTGHSASETARGAARGDASACDDRSMSDDDADRTSFEDVARALADEVTRAVERISRIDVDEIARTAGADAERARQWIDDLGRWVREQADAVGATPFGASEPWDPRAPADPTQSPSAGEDPLREAGPHPLDLPTADQGLALAALDSGRWKLEPGTSALAVHGDGPGPSDALGLVRELRVRDWMSADGEITVVGRNALSRWLDAADRA